MKRLIFGLIISLCSLHVMAQTNDFNDAVKKDTEWIAAGQTRVVGSRQHDEVLAKLIERVKATGAKTWIQDFDVVVPQLESATLEVKDGALAGSHQIYPLWPDLVRLKTTPANGISGTVNYIGSGTFPEIKPNDLNGNIAVMEMNNYENWKKPFQFGAEAVLLLDGAVPVQTVPSKQALYMPRYFVPKGPLNDALRKGEIKSATIKCAASWKKAKASNVFALVVPENYKGGEQAVVLAGQFDSMSTIMGVAPGTDAAVDSAFLLNALEKYSKQPPKKPVLFVFIDAFCINQHGVLRAMAMLSSKPDQPDRKKYEKEDKELLEKYEEAVKLFDSLAGGPDKPFTKESINKFYKRQYRDIRQNFKDELSPELRALEQDLSVLRVQEAKSTDPAEKKAVIDQVKQKAERRGQLNTIRNQIMQKYGVDERLIPDAISHMETARLRCQRQLAELKKMSSLYSEDDKFKGQINDVLKITDPGRSAALFVLGIDLSDAGITVGPQIVCRHWMHRNILATKEFMRWLRQSFSDKSNRIWDENAERAVNIMSITGSDDASSFNRGETPSVVVAAGSFVLPSVSWGTLEALRFKVDTPHDTLEEFQWERVYPQINATFQLVDRMLNGDDFMIDAQSGLKPEWRRVRGTIVDVSIGDPVPSVPMENYLVTVIPDWLAAPESRGVRRTEFLLTGADGKFRYEGIPSYYAWGVGLFHVEAFKLADDGTILRATTKELSLLKASKEKPSVSLSEPLPSPMRAVVFDCLELNGPEFFDSRYLIPLNQFSFIDRAKGGAPKWSNVTIDNGQLHAMIDKRALWQIIMREGVAGTRAAMVNLTNSTAQTEGALRQAMKGRTATDKLNTISTYLSVIDFHSIDGWRLDKMRKAGIIVPVVEKFFKKGEDLIKDANAAFKNNEAQGVFRSSIEAMAVEIRAYETIKSTNDDVARGAIFLLLLILPFSVVMERLVFASVNIMRRIAGAFGIFFAMSAVLWSFHPAFRISSQPVVILMSFSILALSAVVIGIIMSRFGAFLDEIRSGRAEASGAKTSRGGLISSAIFLGIENMRKRKFRTALTATTIVLITFALLCFSSARNYTEKKQFNLSEKGIENPMILIRQPGSKILYLQAKEVIQALVGNRMIVPRYWLATNSKDWRMYLRNPVNCRQVSLKALIGMTPEESSVSPITSLVKDWDKFSKGGGCYIAKTTADNLGVKAGDKIILSGLELEVIDTYDQALFKEKMMHIDGASMLPIDYAAMDAKQGSQTKEGSVAERSLQTVSAENLNMDKQLPSVAADDVVIVHERESKKLYATIRSIAIPLKDKEETEKIASILVDSLSFPIYYGHKDSVKVMVSVPLMPKAPKSLLIPLLIAALIILNTMMNSVAERKGEIHIYTSLGLAPAHVGALFIAEAATYGLMGSIFGYVVGQGAATVLSSLGLMGGITLNYSGTQVIMTMGLVIGVTMLSGLIPAIIAGKIATPSGSMTWKVPAPVNGVICDMLPFTTTPAASSGLIAFIAEYIDAHKDGAIGNFTSTDMKIYEAKDSKAIECIVWLAPYDLGVKQEIKILIKKVEDEVDEVSIELKRLTGEESSWRKLNKPFIGDLRRQFLGWRKLSSERILKYIETGKELVVKQS